MDHAPTGRLPVPRTRSLNSLATATSDAEAKRSAIRGRSPSMRGNAPPPPPGTTTRTSMISRPSPTTTPRSSVSPSPRATVTSTRTPSVMSTTGARTITRAGAPPPPPVRSSFIRAPSPATRRASMPQIDGEGLPDSVSAAASDETPRVRTHHRSASTASESGISKPSATRQLTQPQAPSFMTRTKSADKRADDKRVSMTTRTPPPAPARKVPPAAAAKAQELQSRLDALKKTAEQLRAKSAVKSGSVVGIKKPGDKSNPSSPKTSLKTIVEKEDKKVGEEGESVVSEQEEQDKKEKQLTIQRDMSLKDEREKYEKKQEDEEAERARKEQELLVKEQQARKDSVQVRAAAALERKLAEEKRVEKEKQDKKQRDDDEAEIKQKEDDERVRREREREEAEEVRRKKEQAERDELDRKREQEEREERQREEERREVERRRDEEEAEKKRVAQEKEREEEENRRKEQERLLQETEEAEREQVRQRLEKEDAERKRVKEEEERKRKVAEEEARKQREKQEEERKKQEEERRKQREKEEEERRQQKSKEEEERRRQREREEEERRMQSEREAEVRRKQKEEEEERRKQKEKDEEERRRRERETEDKRKVEEQEKKRIQEEETRKRLLKEKEEAETKKRKEEEEEKKRKAAVAAVEKEKKDMEEKKAREEKARAAAKQNEEDSSNNEEMGSNSNLSTITKTKMAGGGRKARSGMKFDASASTDVVKAPKPGDLPVRSESVYAEAKEEPEESDLRPERKPFMGVGMNGLAGLAAQASVGLAGLKPLARTGDRAAVKSPGARKGPFEITLKTDGKNEKVIANNILDALDNVAKGQFWAILGFDNEMFSLTATGEGVGQSCLDGMKEYLTPTNICFIYFNSGSGGDKDEGAVKCTEIMWQGEKTKLLVKARAGAIRETLHLFTKRCFTIGVQKEASAHDDMDVSRIFGSSGEVTSSPIQASPAQEVRASPSPSFSPSPSPQLLSTPRRASAIPPLATRTPPTAAEFKAAAGASAGNNPLRPDIQWTGQDDISKAVKDFLAAEGSGVFFVLDIEGPKKNEVKVAGAGVGALTDDWREKYCQATKCSVFVIKAENKESGYVSLEKIVYIQWVGKQVKILEKGRAKEIYSGLKEFVREQCGTLAGEMEVLEGQASDVNLQAVTESITGSRQRGNASIATSAKKVERATGAPVDLSYTDEDELRSIIARISEEKLTWVALTYSANKAATLEILGSGVGENTSISWGKEPTKEQEDEQNKRDRQPDTPTAQYKKYCKQSNIVFIVHRFLRIPEQFQFSKDMGTYAKSHFGLMMWQGEDCRVMDKAASSHHWKDFCTLVRDVMEKAGVYVEAGVYVATKMDELNPRDIRKGMRMDMY